MANFPKPPVTTDFHKEGQPAPTFAWERWFQAITDFLTAPQIPLQTPATSSAKGLPGMITYDANFVYVCISQNQWKRVALSAF